MGVKLLKKRLGVTDVREALAYKTDEVLEKFQTAFEFSDVLSWLFLGRSFYAGV